MGYVVLHLDKAKGNESAMSAHIERTQIPKNADPNRAHLNRELVEYPSEVSCRLEAIQHRLDNAGLQRKIGKNQVRVIRVMLTGTNEDMKRIEAEGRLNAWCDDNLAWLNQTFGSENVVSAVLHLDEATPHIHASVVPIVTGERRKTKNTSQPNKKQYRKKNPNAPRLCVDDIMTRSNLKGFQDSYAEAMAKYGLQRGVDGSKARHITTQEFYRNAIAQEQGLKESIESLKYQREDAVEKVHMMYEYRDEARDKFLFVDNYLKQRTNQLSEIEKKLETAKKELEPYQAQEELDLVYSIFPKLKEHINIAQYCTKIGLSIDNIRELFRNGTLKVQTTTLTFPLAFSGYKLNTRQEELNISLNKDNEHGLELNINDIEAKQWFKQQQKSQKNHHLSPPKTGARRKL